MHLLKSMIVAFSAYSAIPMPKIEWDEKNRKYALCFFPIIGIAVGAVLLGWHYICSWANFGSVLFAVGMTVLPVLVTGGIHLDGFCDTLDALCSHQPKERKLEILKDPHTGAFATIGCVVYFLVTFGLWTELASCPGGLIGVWIGMVLSRSFSGLAAVSFTPAKKDGFLASFSQLGSKKTIQLTMTLYLLMGYTALFYLGNPLFWGILVAGTVLFWYYKHLAYRAFGGVTGDLAGFFLVVCEWGFLGVTVVTCTLLK